MSVKVKGPRYLDSKGFVVVSTLERSLNRRVNLTASGVFALAGTVTRTETAVHTVGSTVTRKSDG